MENEPENLENPPQRFQNYPAQNVVIYDDTVLSKRIELIESGHRRIERSQEDMRDRFKKMENNIDSIEKLTKEGLKVHMETKRKEQLKEYKQQLLDQIGNDAYGGVDLFEGTKPSAPELSATQAASPLANKDPSDAGVDISGIVALGGKNWKALMG